jgi:anti-anti-sigma factor
MLRIAIHHLGDVTIYRCKGRIVFGCMDRLLTALSKQLDIRIAVFDLAEVRNIDAAGIGALVGLRKRAKASGVALKLMNLTPKLEALLELFNLRTTFEVCSLPEMLGLLCRALEQSQFVNIEPALEPFGECRDHSQTALAETA